MQGQILVPTATGTALVPIPDPTSSFDMAGIRAWQAATAAAYTVQKNAELKLSHTQAVTNYNFMMASGVFRNGPPGGIPIPPPTYIFIAEGPNDGMPTWSQTGPPVVSDVAITTVNNALLPPAGSVPGVFGIGDEPLHNTDGKIYAAPGDTFPDGEVKQLPAAGPNGKPITIIKHVRLFGGYWEVIG